MSGGASWYESPDSHSPHRGAPAILLALLGGAAGISAGAISTIIYAHVKHWTAVVPATAWGGGLAAAILIGAMAGLLPRSAPPAFPQPKPFEPSEPTVSR